MTRNNRLFPMPPDHIKESDYIDLTSRNSLSRIYVWGLSSYGALGIPEYLQPIKKNLLFVTKRMDILNLLSIVIIQSDVRMQKTKDVVDVSCGFGFTLFVTKNKEYQLLGCGLNKDGQIGYHLNEKNKPLDILIQPTKIQLPDEARISKVSCGRAHSLILSKDGRGFTLGNNANVHTLDHFNGDRIQNIVAGQDHSLFLSEEGSVSLVKGDIKNERIVKLACAADCCLALNDKGEVFGWGNAEPTLLPLNKELGRIIDVASGGSVCYVLNEKS
ncbi:RCC1L [Lepeophtheirus salmonis]|uniref:RCC1L n=1 Tax=Lepeophtheirus salmonis TaxID=72036 RepID=A0A7R8CZW3_LEPSM|nr:RCC1L [Lepeophtheirus salmonis]CAF2953971.1 RCC1L [Lepeophtheirus salmonis]